MFVLLVANEKGGAGKTTLATALAVAAEAEGVSTVVVDVDPQATASFWRDTRKAETPACIASPVSRLPKILEAASSGGADLVIIDGQPTARDALFEAAEIADFVLIPTRPAVFDVHSAVKALGITRRTSTPVAVVVNLVTTPAPPEVADAEEAVRKMGVELVPVRIHQRVAHQRAQQQGLTAMELEPGGKAGAEVLALWAFIKSKISAKSEAAAA